jgi:hypothetical protein
VERKHQVVRKALEHYMQEKGSFTIKTLEEAYIYVPHQINNMSMVQGFSPAQWVFGRTPASTHSLTAELFNPGCDALDEPTQFAEVQRRRVMAQRAWISADSERAHEQDLQRGQGRRPDWPEGMVLEKSWIWNLAEGQMAWTGKSGCQRSQRRWESADPVADSRDELSEMLTPSGETDG